MDITPEELRALLYQNTFVTLSVLGGKLEIDGIVGKVLPQSKCVLITLVTSGRLRTKENV